MADSLSDTISDNAQGPRRASGDSGSIEQHPLGDQMDADRYGRSKEVWSKRGYMIQKIKPPGAV